MGKFLPQVFVISTSLSLKAASTLRKMRLFAECRMPLFMARHQPSSIYIYIHTFGIEPAPSRPFSPTAGWHWSTLQAHSRIADELVATRVIQAVAKQHLVDPSTAKMFTRKQPHPDRSKSSSQIQRQWHHRKENSQLQSCGGSCALCGSRATSCWYAEAAASS